MSHRKLPQVLAATLLLTAACKKSEGSPKLDPTFDQKPAPRLEVLKVARTGADLGKPDPDAAFWQDVPRGFVSLMAQPMVKPRPEKTTTDSVVVQAVHDGKRVAFRLVWTDPEVSEGGPLGQYSDAIALQFPSNGDVSTPVMMGAPGMPVHIYHWRAQYQRDAEQGKPEIATLYPNSSIDMYAMDFKEAPGGDEAAKESFLPARAQGNPQSYAKKAVDEIVAEGFGTSAVQDGSSATGRAIWRNGRWALVLTRPLVSPERSAIKAPGDTQLAFAIWQGGKAEVGSRKSVTMAWLPVKVQ